MKAAFIKQKSDVYGPWAGVQWKTSSPKKLFEVWPAKPLYWEFTCLLKADWFVIEDPPGGTEHIRLNRKQTNFPAITSKYTADIIPANKIPYENYDVILSIDPILEAPRHTKTLFVYYHQEHWDKEYRESLQKPFKNYDLFLDHMMNASPELQKIPQSIAFPYLYDSGIARSVILNGHDKEDVIWVDWRTASTLGRGDWWDSHADAAVQRLQKVLPRPIRRKADFAKTPAGITDPPSWGDGLKYLTALGECKYYISLGRASGAGQGLCEAASLNCICIGEISRPYHKLICHPACLCDDLADLPSVIKKVVSSKTLQEEALVWQDAVLKKYFKEKPLQQIEYAIELKSKQLSRTR